MSTRCGSCWRTPVCGAVRRLALRWRDIDLDADDDQRAPVGRHRPRQWQEGRHQGGADEDIPSREVIDIDAATVAPAPRVEAASAAPWRSSSPATTPWFSVTHEGPLPPAGADLSPVPPSRATLRERTPPRRAARDPAS